MNSIDEPMGLPRCTIMGNPLFSPDSYLLSAQKVRRKWSFKKDAYLRKNSFDMAYFSSAPKTFTLYSFFEENHSGNFAIVGRGYRDAVIRILPDGNSFEEECNFIDGVGVMEKALERGFIETIRYSSALMKIIDAVVDFSSETRDTFDKIITEQIEDIGNRIEEAGLSEQEVHQVTELGDGKVVAFPKGFFDDTGTPRRQVSRGLDWGSIIPKGGLNPV